MDTRMTRDEHPDDGTIHAWLDGALDPQAAKTIAAHVATCASCRERVAEARGLIAGASRIVGALDDVPTTSPAWGTTPRAGSTGDPATAQSTWRRLRLTPTRAAIAATLLVAAGVTLTYRRTGPDTVTEVRARVAADSAASVAASALRPVIAPDTSPAMRVAAGRVSAKAVRESTSAVADRARTDRVPVAPGAPSVEARVAGAAAKLIDTAARGAGAAPVVVPPPTVQTATTVPIPAECYRIESAGGSRAVWGSVEAPFVIALDASGGGARVLTADGVETGTTATWTKGGEDSVVVRLRRSGFEGTMTLGAPADVRAGVMRSAPVELALSEGVATRAAGGDLRPTRRARAAERAPAPAAQASSARAAPAVPIVARATGCPPRR